MGGGASKSKTDLSVPGGHHNSIHSRERRMSHIETNPPPQSEKLVKCPHCDRNFAEDRVDRHVDVSSFMYVVDTYFPATSFFLFSYPESESCGTKLSIRLRQ